MAKKSSKYSFSLKNLADLGVSAPVGTLVLVAAALVMGAILVSSTQPVHNTQVLGASTQK